MTVRARRHDARSRRKMTYACSASRRVRCRRPVSPYPHHGSGKVAFYLERVVPGPTRTVVAEGAAQGTRRECSVALGLLELILEQHLQPRRRSAATSSQSRRSNDPRGPRGRRPTRQCLWPAAYGCHWGASSGAGAGEPVRGASRRRGGMICGGPVRREAGGAALVLRRRGRG